VSLLPVFAEKNKVLPTAVKLVPELDCEPLLMSLTKTVPVSVPSLFQSSSPFVPLFAVKNKVLPTAVRLYGELLPEALMSATCTVPVSVPSVFQISEPSTPLFALKKRVSPTTVNLLIEELDPPGRITLKRLVPAAVPLLTQS